MDTVDSEVGGAGQIEGDSDISSNSFVMSSSVKGKSALCVNIFRRIKYR